MCGQKRNELVRLLSATEKDCAIRLLKWPWANVGFTAGLHDSLPPISELVQEFAARSPVNAYIQFLVLLEIKIQIALHSFPLIFRRFVGDGCNLHCYVSPAGRDLQIARQQVEHDAKVPIGQPITKQ